MADDDQTLPAPDADTAPVAEPEPPSDVDRLKKALDAERASRREAEKARKAADAELDKVRTAQLSETERAIVDAKAAGRAEVLAETGRRVALAEFRAAAAAAGLDVAEVLDLIDVSRFVAEDGATDSAAITAAVEKFAAVRGETQSPAAPSLGMDLGPRPTTTAAALNGDPLLRDLKATLGIR